MLNSESGAVVTALPVAEAGGLPPEKQGELRVAAGAVIPNLSKIKMKSTKEGGQERSIRGHITEVAKPLLSAAEVSKRWDSYLFEDGGILLEGSSPPGPGWTMEIRLSRFRLISLRRSRESQPLASLQGWKDRSISR